MKSVSLLAAALGLTVVAVSPAVSCETHEGSVVTREAHLKPLSVPAADIDAWLNASPYSSGIRFKSALHGRDLWLDITAFPKQAPEVGSVRALMQMGRVATADFDQLVLVDGEQALFVISEPDLRGVGCQFMWPGQKGTDPISLMRQLVEALREGQGLQPLEGLSPDGSAGTTIHAMALIEDHLNPAWVASARPGAASPTPGDRHPDHIVELEAPRVQAMAVPANRSFVVGGL
jgi:hypothetical protein